MARRSVGSVDTWWQALEATRVLRGLSRRELARAIHAAIPRRSSEGRRSPSYAEVYHRSMLIPRAFAAMEALGCRLCGWRTLAETLAGLEDRRRSTRGRPAPTASPASSGSRTLLRDALAGGDLWIEIDDVDDAAFEAALARVADEGAAVVVPATAIPRWSPDTDARLQDVLDRLDRLEGRPDSADKRGSSRRSHVAALEERVAALEARVLAIEVQLQGEARGREMEAVAAIEGSSESSEAMETALLDPNELEDSVAAAPSPLVADADDDGVDCDPGSITADPIARAPTIVEILSMTVKAEEEKEAAILASFGEYVVGHYQILDGEPATPASRATVKSKDRRERMKEKRKEKRKQQKLARRR